MDVCKPKEKDVLGVKDIELFNLSLLGKWRLRLLIEKEALWCKVLRAKYGEEVSSNPNLSLVGTSR